MKNFYLPIEEYKRYLSLFEMNEEEKEEANRTIETVQSIVTMKRQTVQTSPNNYLKPIMLPSDYKKIIKAYSNQLELRRGRFVAEYKKELEAECKYTEDEIEKKVKKYFDDLTKELGIRKKSKKVNIKSDETEDFNLEDILEGSEEDFYE